MTKTKAVKDWESLVASYGCVVTRESQPIQLHHVRGRTYKHNKVLIGPWFILPLAFRLHDVSSNHSFNVTHWPKRFEIEYGKQKALFLTMCANLVEHGHRIPFDDDVLKSIINSPSYA